MDKQKLNQKTTLSLHEAAQLLSATTRAVHDSEVAIAHAIEHGKLHANVKRWATEQWEGKQLPGNINRLETFIERIELDAWQKSIAAVPNQTEGLYENDKVEFVSAEMKSR